MKIKNMAAKYGIFVALVLLIIFFSITSSSFLSIENVMNILRQVAVIGICAVGMTFIILTGGIDLSVGSIVGVAAVLDAKLMVSGINPISASIISLAAGAVLGGLNGFIINEFHISPLIATLGTMTSLRGVAYLITKGVPVYGFPNSFSKLGQGNIGSIPISVIIMIIVFIFGYVVLNKMVFGRYVYGIGGNEEASRLSGVHVKKVKYLIYVIAGFLASLAGIVLLSRVNSGAPTAGTGYEMDVITAVVLGGVSIIGGEGSIFGVIMGVMIMGVLANGMIIMNINDYYQMIIKGAVLLAAVAFDQMSKRNGAEIKDRADVIGEAETKD